MLRHCLPSTFSLTFISSSLNRLFSVQLERHHALKPTRDLLFSGLVATSFLSGFRFGISFLGLWIRIASSSSLLGATVITRFHHLNYACLVSSSAFFELFAAFCFCLCAFCSWNSRLVNAYHLMLTLTSTKTTVLLGTRLAAYHLMLTLAKHQDHCLYSKPHWPHTAL